MNKREANAICTNIGRLTTEAAHETRTAAKKELRVTARTWAKKLAQQGYRCACRTKTGAAKKTSCRAIKRAKPKKRALAGCGCSTKR